MSERALVSKELASLFNIFSHPDRIRIAEELRDRELNVKELQEILGISHSRVSQHVGQLKSHRLLLERHEGRCRYYRLAKPELAQWILGGLAFLDTTMPAIKRINDAVTKVQEVWGARSASSARSEPAKDQQAKGQQA